MNAYAKSGELCNGIGKNLSACMDMKGCQSALEQAYEYCVIAIISLTYI